MLPDYWQLLQSHPALVDQRHFVDVLNQRYRPYADANFEVDLPLQFGARFWEMYLGCALLDLGFELKERESRPDSGPDLCVRWNARRVWIEAIAPLPGTGADAVPALDDDGGWTPEAQIVLRYRSAVEAKWHSRRKYIASRLTAADEPFVVAVNGFQIPGGHNAFSDEIPFPVQSVLPLGCPTVTIDRATGRAVAEGFQTRWHIEKQSGALVRTAVFLDRAYSCISGILFSGSHPLYARTIHTGSMGFLHNPNADAPLPRGWLGVGTEYWVEENRLHFRRSGRA